jgi:hypothetical protein
VTNNTISNVSNATTGGMTGMIVGFSDNTFSGNEVSGNTISNIASSSATATAALVGISSSAGNQNFTNNTVHTLSAAGTNAVTGILVTGATVQNLSRNRIYNLSHSGAGGLVNGISVTSGTTTNIFNNLIGDLRAPTANGANPVVGLNLSGGTTVNADYNSVFLNATSSGAAFGSSAVSASASGTPTLTLRNNNLVNNSISNGTGLSVAYRRSGTALTTYGAASNSNNLFAPVLFFDGTNSDTTITTYRARMAPRDAGSVTENPNFVSTAGNNANFLNINTASPTRLESSATPIATITTDFAGLPRAATPDVGAWEFAGTFLDDVPPSIGYVPLNNTTSLANRTINATINDPSGVGSGANGPRVYFRKGAAAYQSTACAGTVPSFTCTIDVALMGGVVPTDVINYFVIAQDVLGNVGAVPGAGLVASNVNTVTTPPTTPASYTVVTAFPSTVSVGPGQAFTSLTNAGGLFEALNAGVLASNVVASIAGDLAGETGGIVLNQLVEDGPNAGSLTLTIRPAAATTAIVSGSFAGCLVRLNGADRVTIDGSNVIGGTTRNLTFNNTSTSTSAGGVCISSLGLGQGAVNNTLQNFNVLGADATTTLLSVGVGGAGIGTSGANNNDTRIQNLSLRRSIFGIFASGEATSLTTGTVIEGNDLTGTAAERIRRVGILVFNDDGTQITGNRIAGIDSNESADSIGIGIGIQDANNATTLVGGGVINALVARNEISGAISASTTGFSAVGIAVGGGTGANTIANNMIRGVIAPATAPDFVAGIFVAGSATASTRVVFNSIFLTGDRGIVASQVPAHGIALTGTSSVEMRNNIVVNSLISGGGANASSFLVGTGATTFANLTASNNIYNQSGAQAAGFRTGGLTAAAGGTVINHATLAAWQTAIGGDAASQFADPLFVSATDLHIQATSPASNTGVAIAGITTDIDGQNRSATTPEIGADELAVAILTITPNSVNFGNQLVGTTSAAQAVTLGNTGNVSLIVDPLTAAAAPFARSGGSCSAPPITIAGGSSCTLEFTFAPTATGPATQNLTVTSSGEGSGSITLSGTGIQGNLTITPASVNFGNQLVGTTSAEQTVRTWSSQATRAATPLWC